MGLLSSKSFIKLHALFQFLLAVYLTNSREVISDSELVYNGDNGMSIDVSSIFTRPRSPFAYCGIILIVFALFDLVLATKLPMLNQLIAISRLVLPNPQEEREVRGEGDGTGNGNGNPTSLSAAISKAADEFKSLFTHICVLLAVVRFCAFSLVARKIFASAPDVWRASVGGPSTYMPDGDGATMRDIGTRLEMAKMKVVLGYLYMEIMFSLWVIQSLLDERRQTETQLRFVQARVLRS